MIFLRQASVIMDNEPLRHFLSDPNAWNAVVQELRLTPRQQDIVRLILRGKRNKEIAVELNIKIPTIQTQLDRVYRRHGLEDRVDLILTIFGLAWKLKTS